ncbi:Vitamin B12-binding protein [uncultured Comamonas sp.]|nr:Vitamin B12-binding protein [uncultured Comamonas sp.]
MYWRISQILRWLLSIVFFCETIAAFAQPLQMVAHHAGVDGLGRPVVQGAVPQRIVSLQPALTEAVCALGECRRLVGVDRYSSWPAEAIAALPVVGGGLDPSLEAIVALRPDVVLLTRAAPIRQRLEALGVRTLALDAENQAGVERMVSSLALLLDKPRAGEQLWQRVQAAIDATARALPADIRGVRVYVEVSRGPYAAGTSSYIGEILARMGAVNIVPPDMGPFPLVSPEFVLRSAPQVMIQGDANPQQQPPGWERLEAVRAQRICRFAPEQANILLRPGPRMDEAARLLAQCLLEKAPRHAPASD